MSRAPRRITLCLACIVPFLGSSACTYYPFGNDEHRFPPEIQHAPAARRPAVHRQQATAMARAPAIQSQAGSRMDGVIGLDERELASRFGSPSTREDHHPGTSWIYRDAGCRLKTAFYPQFGTHVNKASICEV